ncbi:signal peptide peptidase-like 1 [Brassica napus]|uniref:signal peptide peptidase-like 1 n=1 Tax=Brassica napus TaxID=3708 RepID=UPI0006AAA522|nr:signal peptide peptidase-like 1 [Brassica napus]
MLLLCLFVYDIFWVFFSERFFGTNVMVTVATQQASNPVHTVANSLNLPGLELITKKLELPVKIVFRGVEPGVSASEFMMLGLGDMVALYVGGLYICGKTGWESVMKMGQDTRELSRMKRTV